MGKVSINLAAYAENNTNKTVTVSYDSAGVKATVYCRIKTTWVQLDSKKLVKPSEENQDKEKVRVGG